MSGRKASVDVIPGLTALSVGMPDKKPPEGWKWYPLNEVAVMATGHTPSRRHPEYWGGEIPWISVADARPYHGRVIQTTKENTNPLGIQNSAAVLLPKDTVCLSRTGSIGYSIILGKPMATSQGFVNWICGEKLLPRFLQLMFVAENSFLHFISEGVAHTTIYFPAAKAFHVCLPSYDEQVRIISKVEELFSELDKNIEQLERAQQQLKAYRQSVLKWAYEKSASSTFYRLSEACEFITKGTTPSKADLSSDKGEVPFLKVYNLTFDGSVDFTKAPTFVTKEISNGFLKRSQVYPGDVLMNIVGPPLGKVSVVPDTFAEWNINQAIVRFRCKEMLLNKFLMYFLLSENTIRAYSKKAKATAGQFNLTLEICRDIEIYLPSLEEQKQIVQEIESRLSVADKLEETITNSLQQAEALKQSILKRAFEGKLIGPD